MKKAFIDQILLGFLLFTILIIIGATVSDDVDARNKYYKLKSLTDNTALSAAKYYIMVNKSTSEAEDIANAMLEETNLGLEIVENIEYNWNFSSVPNTVTVTLPSYTHDTFWYRFIDLNSFDINTSSVAEVVEGGDITESADLTPFGINGCDETHLTEGSELTFDLRGHNGYDFTDYSEFYGIDVGDGCTSSGNSNWAHFKNLIKNFYVEDGFLKNDDDLLDTDNTEDFCVPTVSKLSMEQDNDPKQISQSFSNLENSYDLEDVEMDMALFACGSTADNLIIQKFIKVKFLSNPSPSYDKVKNDYDVFQFDLRIIGSTLSDKIKLVK